MSRTSTDPAASMALLRDLMRDDVGLEYAEAAQRRAERAQADPASAADQPGGTRGRTRTVVLAVTIALVGGVLAIGAVQRKADEPAAQATREALVARAEAADARVAALEAAVASTRAELAELQEAALADTAEGEAVSARIDRLSEATGYTAVAGPGGVVVLDDAKGVDRSDASAPGRVLDSDVQTAVNGLWQAGAEAVAVNGRRLTSTTAIRTAGAAILVDFKPLVPPYRVEAIGDPATLMTRYAATASARSLAQVADQYGLRVTTTTADRVDLPAATALLPTTATVPGERSASASPSTSSSKGTP